MLSGSIDKDDRSGGNVAKNSVTLDAVQTYSGATYVEAGTLTLGVANAIADSSGVTLGRVDGAVDGQAAGLVLDANDTLALLSGDTSNTTSVVSTATRRLFRRRRRTSPPMAVRRATARHGQLGRSRHGNVCAYRRQDLLRRPDK